MTLFICGDSTAASYGPELTPLTGWGQLLPELLPGVAVVNRAIAGRSTRTFIGEGRLKGVEVELNPGDLMLIQFGHNDGGDRPERHTEPWADFTDNLGAFIDAAQTHEARPVLMTPICIRCWEGGALLPSHGEYIDAVRALSRRRNIPLIDMYAISFNHVRSLGDEGSKAMYMHFGPGLFPHWPDGSADDTHTCGTPPTPPVAGPPPQREASPLGFSGEATSTASPERGGAERSEAEGFRIIMTLSCNR